MRQRPRFVRPNPLFVAWRWLALRRAATMGPRELSFAMWLTVKGVEVARWQNQAGRSTASS